MFFMIPLLAVAIPVALVINHADQEKYKQEQQQPGGQVCINYARDMATKTPTFSSDGATLLERQLFEECMKKTKP